MNAVWKAQDRFRPAPTVRRVLLGGRSLVFCERRQQLFELNRTADLIWRALLEESPPRAARRLCAELGFDPDQALALAQGQLEQWLDEGLWRPAGPQKLAPSAETELRLAVDGLKVQILCADRETRERLHAVFGQFPAFAGAPTLRLGITAGADGMHLFEGDRHLGALTRQTLIPQVKALLTERVTGQSFAGFFAHGALLAKGRTLAMLSGAPGAGKSTLALALQAAGWSLLADDLIRVDGAARFHGIPFAPATKAGAWPLLAALRPELMREPVELRSDGQTVRYAPLAPPPALKPRTPDLFIALARQPGAAAQAQPMDPVEALSALLGEAFSARGRLSADLMVRLARRLGQAHCRRLIYSALPEAVDTIEALARAL
jgi:hypothetical protein